MEKLNFPQKRNCVRSLSFLSGSGMELLSLNLDAAVQQTSGQRVPVSVSSWVLVTFHIFSCWCVCFWLGGISEVCGSDWEGRIEKRVRWMRRGRSYREESRMEHSEEELGWVEACWDTVGNVRDRWDQSRGQWTEAAGSHRSNVKLALRGLV